MSGVGRCVLRRDRGVRLVDRERRRDAAPHPRLCLRTNALGELGVEAYYTFGPLVAAPVGESELLRATARTMFRPLVDRVRRLAF